MKSQSTSILDRLLSKAGSWVPMPELASVSGAYAVHSRISDLRKAGHEIEHRNERRGRIVASFYRLRK